MILAATNQVSATGQRIEVIAVALIVCLLIFELIRRKRLLERYALVWLAAGATVLLLALWKGLLTTLSHAVGVAYPPSALFVVTFLFVLVMLVNFSTTVSRLSDQNTVLAQRVALLQRTLEDQQDAPGAVARSLAGERRRRGADPQPQNRAKPGLRATRRRFAAGRSLGQHGAVLDSDVDHHRGHRLLQRGAGAAARGRRQPARADAPARSRCW